MNLRFDELGIKGKINAAKVNLDSAINGIATQRDNLKGLAEARLKPKNGTNDKVIESYEKAFKAFNLDDMKSVLEMIERHLTGNVPADDILKLTYDLSYSDIRAVAPLANVYQQNANYAVSVYAAVYLLQNDVSFDKAADVVAATPDIHDKLEPLPR